MLYESSLVLPRNAFSARDAARAGDVWRAFQDVATEASTAAGWPPDRYRAEGVAFVVRQMTAVHHREARYGERIAARTGISQFKRGLLVTRQLWLDGGDGPLARATQEWAHVRIEDGTMRPARAPDSLVTAFTAIPPVEDVALPAWEPVEGAREHVFSFRCWWTWMDPLAHANHPAYVDWADEALAVALAPAGVDPIALAPVAERVRWRAGVVAPAEVIVRTRVIGTTDEGFVVCEHRIEAGGVEAAAIAHTVRRLADGGDEALLYALI